MTTIDLVYFDAGGGHRTAALALQAAILQQGRPWNVRLVHFVRAIDPDGRMQRLLGGEPEGLYNWRLRHGLTFGLGAELRMLQGAIRAGRPWLERALVRHWSGSPAPDLVVSLVPNFNGVLRRALGRACPQAAFVTVMTDFADLPPRFWIEPGLDLHIVCGTARALEQAYTAGYGPDRAHRTSGMVLRPDFYRNTPLDRRAERRALGLDPDRPIGLVMFGGHGSPQMMRIARRLDDQPLILLCGHNARLAERLRAMRRSAPHAVIGFTSDVQRYMRVADWFVGKPGPGAMSEALHCGLPVVTFRNAWTMPQERYNTEWVETHGVGCVVEASRQLPATVRGLLADLDRYRARVAAIDNRAVFEIPALLERVLRTAPTVPGDAAVLAGATS